jgi:mannose-6-phosphate isomerase-like protein (cupin superfamily)
MKVVRFAKIAIPLDASLTRHELLASGKEWQPHRNTYHYTGEWDVLPLRSPGGNHTNPVPELLNENSFSDTIYMDHFPSVKQLVGTLQCTVMSVRFLNLKAGAVIKEHRDMQLALEQGEARLHFPIITNPQVKFYCENERIFLNEDDCWYLNANLPHRVSNHGKHDRIHLVIDCQVNAWLKKMILESEIISVKKEPVDPNILAQIKYWREENSPESNKQAAILEDIVERMMQDE